MATVNLSALITPSNVVTTTSTSTLSNKTLVAPALGTPASGVVTNLTGTASININGTVGATTPATGAFTSVNTPNTFGFKNRIINGDMRIDQRNSGSSITLTTSASYPVDRWAAFEESDGVMTAQRVADAPTGFLNSIKFTTTTADSSITGAERVYTLHGIEAQNMVDLAWGTASAKAVTVSFWVKSSLTGTFGGSLRGNLNYPFSYTISSANTWEQKTINIAGPTTGTWPTDNSLFVYVTFGMGIGPSLSGGGGAWTASNFIAPSGAVAVIGTLNATFQVTGVQLEKGDIATSFDVRPYGTELALCQRYFQMVGTGTGKEIAFGAYWGTAEFDCFATFQTSMRTAPTIYQVTGTNYFGIEKSGGDDVFDAWSGVARATTFGGLLYVSGGSVSGTAGYAAVVQTLNSLATLAFQSEL
jgi:hypothetical protein